MHVPVFLARSLEWLRIREDGVYVDCTAGAGGHSAAIAERLTTGRLVALDRDPDAVEMARARLSEYPQAVVMHRNYGDVAEVLRELGIASVDGVLLDAGCSSMQLDDGSRGFSFQADGPLDMRMDPSRGLTAAEFLRTVREQDLADLLKRFGDVGPAKRVAHVIVERGKQGRLNTTQDLRGAVAEALPFVHKMPEETRTVFQAIRMAVNDELRWLEHGLHQAIEVMAPGGRLVAIAFHSGEDRVVKQVFREASRKHRDLGADGRVVSTRPAQVTVLTAAPERPSDEETARNPRAKSARMRVVERISTEF